MLHVGLDKVASRESAAKGQLAGQGGCGNDASEAAGIFTGGGGVGSANAEHVEHGGLGLEDGAATEGADFNGRHGDGDLERAAEAAQR